jgi:hypothetical protein
MRIAAMALLLLFASAPAIRAQAAADLDTDGVADAVDACPDTEPGDLVGPDGCASCPCDGPANADRAWSARYEYLQCVVETARMLRDDAIISHRGYRDALRHARLSSCGESTKTRCCLYRNVDDETGRCRIMDADRCDPGVMHQFDADDVDEGSCLPNPCALQ